MNVGCKADVEQELFRRAEDVVHLKWWQHSETGTICYCDYPGSAWVELATEDV